MSISSPSSTFSKRLLSCLLQARLTLLFFSHPHRRGLQEKLPAAFDACFSEERRFSFMATDADRRKQTHTHCLPGTSKEWMRHNAADMLGYKWLDLSLFLCFPVHHRFGFPVLPNYLILRSFAEVLREKKERKREDFSNS